MLQEQLTTNNSKLIPEAVQFAFCDSASFCQKRRVQRVLEEVRRVGQHSSLSAWLLAAAPLEAFCSAWPVGILIAMLYQHHKTWKFSKLACALSHKEAFSQLYWTSSCTGCSNFNALIPVWCCYGCSFLSSPPDPSGGFPFLPHVRG